MTPEQLAEIEMNIELSSVRTHDDGTPCGDACSVCRADYAAIGEREALFTALRDSQAKVAELEGRVEQLDALDGLAAYLHECICQINEHFADGKLKGDGQWRQLEISQALAAAFSKWREVLDAMEAEPLTERQAQ
jgi:hypothetical protein